MFVPIVLSGHIDTVGPDLQKYETNPYELVVKNGKAYGLGSIDMKSFVAVILDNLDKIKRCKQPVVLAFTTDEETNLYCIENVIEKFKELKITPKFTIIGEPTNCEIQTKANGCYEFEVEVFGKSCHSSKPQNGINAICIVAKIISYIEEEQQKYQNITANCGVIKGGDIINRVPDYARLNFDIRGTNMDFIKRFVYNVVCKIKKLKKEYLGCKITIKKTLEIPPLQDKENEMINDIAKKLQLKLGEFAGGCEAGYYQKYSGDAILFGVGDLNLAHKPNEYVVIKEYEYYSNKFLELIDYLEQKL